MILGIGCDIVKNSRFLTIDNNLIKRIFSKDEISESKNLKEEMKAEFFASRFAVKEAFAKAVHIPVGLFNGNNLIVKKDKTGAPFIIISNDLHKKINEIYNVEDFVIHTSLSHEKEYSIAYVIMESK